MGSQGCLHLGADFPDSHPADHDGSGEKNHRSEQAIFGAIGLTNPSGDGGGVAYFAHVGGFAFGLLAVRLFAHRRSQAYEGPRLPRF